MWTVVYIASNRSTGEMIKELLENEGLLVMLRSLGVPHMGDSANVEVLVPKSEVEEAHELIASAFGR